MNTKNIVLCLLKATTNPTPYFWTYHYDINVDKYSSVLIFSKCIHIFSVLFTTPIFGLLRGCPKRKVIVANVSKKYLDYLVLHSHCGVAFANKSLDTILTVNSILKVTSIQMQTDSRLPSTGLYCDLDFYTLAGHVQDYP